MVLVDVALAVLRDVALVMDVLVLAVLRAVALVLAVESKRDFAAVNFLSHTSMAYIFLPRVGNLAFHGRNQYR